jgi:hypothetical protein
LKVTVDELRARLTAEPVTVVCAQKYCSKTVILKKPGNVPAYCDYTCAVSGQPQYTKEGLRSYHGD